MVDKNGRFNPKIVPWMIAITIILYMIMRYHILKKIELLGYACQKIVRLNGKINIPCLKICNVAMCKFSGREKWYIVRNFKPSVF